MKGYKMMESDISCRGFQYEINKEYSLEDELKICENGFHFCKNPFNCLYYYDNIEGDKRLFIIESLSEVITEGDKSVTDQIKIVEEIKDIEKFFDENIDNFEVNWDYISEYQKLSEELINKYGDKLNWGYISINQKLSESFIDKYNNKVDWYLISKFQKLSEEFIEKYVDEVDWYNILTYQKISKKFIEKHKDKIK